MGSSTSKNKHVIYSLDRDNHKLDYFDCDSVYLKHIYYDIHSNYENPFMLESISSYQGDIYLLGGRAHHSHNHKPVSLDYATCIKLGKTVEKDYVQDEKSTKQDPNISITNYCLPDPRYGHLLIATSQHIFLLGGYIKSKKVKTCLRLSLNEPMLKQIESMDFEWNTPCGIAADDDTLYVFDTDSGKSSLPKIHKYDVEIDLWEEVKVEYEYKEPLVKHYSAVKISPDIIFVVGADSYDKEVMYCFDTWRRKIIKADFLPEILLKTDTISRVNSIPTLSLPDDKLQNESVMSEGISDAPEFAKYKRYLHQGNLNYEKEDYFFAVVDNELFFYDKIKKTHKLIKWEELERKDFKLPHSKREGSNICCSYR